MNDSDVGELVKLLSGSTFIKEQGMKSSYYNIYIISDSTGGLVNHIVKAVLTQYPNIEFQYRIFNFIDDPAKLKSLILELNRINSLVFYGVVELEMNQAIRKELDQLKIPHFDVTESIRDFLTLQFQSSPVNSIDAIHKTDEKYFNRMDALEFTLQHDDSRRIENLKEADIVIMGVSRVSKTPTSIFLGSMGYKAANVSIVSSIGIPDEVLPYISKIVALSTIPRALMTIRKRRMVKNEFDLGLHKVDPNFKYMDLSSIIEEVRTAESLYHELGIPIINIHGLTIEEISGRVLNILKIEKSPYS